MKINEIKKTLLEVFLHKKHLDFGLYEYELEESVEEWKKSVLEDGDDYFLSVTVKTKNKQQIMCGALVFINNSRELYINEEALIELHKCWPEKVYQKNVKNLLPFFSEQLHSGIIPVVGFKMTSIPEL